MTAAEIEEEIRRIGAQLARIDKDTPNMTAMDFANGQGWISQDEWEEAEKKMQESMKVAEAEVAKVEELRRQHPQAMDVFLGAHIARLEKARDELDGLYRAAGEGLPFAARFRITLLPDLISCFQAWRGGTEPPEWPGWMWRLAFSVVEECEKFIAESGKGTG